MRWLWLFVCLPVWAEYSHDAQGNSEQDISLLHEAVISGQSVSVLINQNDCIKRFQCEHLSIAPDGHVSCQSNLIAANHSCTSDRWSGKYTGVMIWSTRGYERVYIRQTNRVYQNPFAITWVYR